MTRRLLLFLSFTTLLITLEPPAILRSQTPDSARYRIYLTITDAITGQSAKAPFGFHPRAKLGLDTDTLRGFTDHWYINDPNSFREFNDPPFGLSFEDIRTNNVRQKFANPPFTPNIHPYSGPSMIDTFIVLFNGASSPGDESLYVYTHPQILSWPSVLRYYADSIILQ